MIRLDIFCGDPTQNRCKGLPCGAALRAPRKSNDRLAISRLCSKSGEQSCLPRIFITTANTVLPGTLSPSYAGVKPGGRQQVFYRFPCLGVAKGERCQAAHVLSEFELQPPAFPLQVAIPTISTTERKCVVDLCWVN